MKRMKVESCFTVLMVIGFVCSWAALPAAADEWSKTYTLTGQPDLRVDTSDANIHVSTWDQKTIEAKVTTERYKIGDDGIRIEELHTGDGHIDLANFKGEMQLHSGDGSQDLDSVDGKLRATTGDGHIRAHGRFDELDLKTGDGHVDAQAMAGSALAASWRLETGDGSVTLGV